MGGKYYVVRLPVPAKKSYFKGMEDIRDQFDALYESFPGKGDYKGYALERTVPASKNQPASLVAKSDRFVKKEYCCPKCAVMFEVDFVEKDEQQIRSVELQV